MRAYGKISNDTTKNVMPGSEYGGPANADTKYHEIKDMEWN